MRSWMRDWSKVMDRDHHLVFQSEGEREVRCEKTVKLVQPRQYRAVQEVAGHQAHPPVAG